MLKKFFVSLVFLTTSALAVTTPQWEKLAQCSFLTSEWNDGDSFHVMHKGKEYIIRLYFVDSPECDGGFPERIAEQAKYFNCSPKRSLEIGREAAQFTAKVLSAKSFTVFTCWHDARGRSVLPRYYGIVEVDGENLAELLVENGLARIYGKRITLPDGKDSKTYRGKLKLLEAKARDQQKGGWKKNS